ncbi:MAG: NAD(+) diphosphatase [Synergistaceae bacterium]|nr:NAD(+) diphosphatase [Synergistaceae bacterium]
MADSVLFLFDASSEGRVLMTPGDPPKPLTIGDQPGYEDVVSLSGRVLRGDGASDVWARLAPGASIPEGLVALERRVLADLLGGDLFTRSGIAYQMMNLTVKNRFCGVCGAAMRDHRRERARECPACRAMAYPTLSPAIIVAVERDGMLLMGHNVNFPAGRYSVLAGFVEPGETLEQAVEREVYEESGIRINNIRYFESQPWPFPSSMMVGFRADWESGDPQPDGEEIADVRWVTPDNLPDLPPSVSISRRLINDWLRRRGSVAS